MKGKLCFPFLTALVFLLMAPSLSHAAKRRGPIILGVGGGYCFLLDPGLRNYEIYHPQYIYFSEQLSMRNNFHFYAQYFPWHGFGFQLEFDHQRARYNSDLKWYGYPRPGGGIIKINHIEDPYSENWNLSSIAASILYVLNLETNLKLRPYISAGFGYYFSNGDEERFYYRTRLGPKKSGNLIKLGIGAKYQIAPKININFRGIGGTVWRKEYGFGEIMEVGPKQFDYLIYAETGKIVRTESLLANSYTFLGIALSLEYTF